MADFATIGFKFDTTGLKQAERGMDSMAAKGERSEKRINKSVDSMNTGFKSMRSTIGLATAALTAFGSARISQEIIKQSDAWKNINSQIRQVNDSEKDLIAVRKQLVDLSKDTRSELTNTVDLYAQLTRSTKDLGTTQEEVLNVTKTLNNLFVAGGKPISEVSGAIRQLSQGFAAGALRGDEFNSVAEGAPKIMDALSAKLKMTRGELREFAATGGITAEIMIDALKDYEDVAQRLADQTTKTFGQAMENANTNLTQFIGEADGLNSVVDSMGAGIEELSENLDALVNGMQAAATVVGVALTPVMGKYIISLGATAKAQLLAGTTATKTANAFGVVTTTAASATVATNALTAATRFLMGPWGLLITAVGAGALAFSDSKDETNELTSAFDEQKKSLDKLVETYGKYSAARIGSTAIDAQKRAIEIDKRRLEIQKQLAEFGNVKSGGLVNTAELKLIQKYGKNVSELQNELKELDKESEKVNETLKAVGQVFENGLPKISDMTNRTTELSSATSVLSQEYISSIDAFGQMFTALHNQRQELTMTSDEFEIYQLKLNAIAAGVLPEYIEKLVKFAKANQEIRKEQEKTTESTEEFSLQMEESIKRLDETFVDVWMGVFDGFESVTDKIINSFKQMLAEMAHAALTRPIVMQIGAAMGLGGASGMANAASGLGSLGSLGGILSSLSGAATTMGLAAQSVTGLLMQGNIGAAFSTVGGAFAGGGLSAGIGAALPIAGIAAAALTVVDKIAGGGLFGTSFKAKDTTLNLGFSGGDATGSTTLLETKKRSLFRGTKKRYTETGLDLSAVDDIFDSVQMSIIEAAELLDITEVTQTITHGFGNLYEKFGESFERYFDATSITTTQTVEEYLNSFSASFSQSIKDMSEEEVQQAIADWTNRTTEQMINAVFGDMVDEFKKEGETSAQTIDRLIVNLKAVGSVTDTLGLDFELTGTEAARASTNIVDLVGGLDSLNAFTTSYYNEFFTPQEKMASLTNDLNDSFESMNINMPQTRDGFRALVEGLDLTTESGQEMFAMLMQLVPGMDAYFDALENGQTQALNAAMAVLEDSINMEKSRAAEILNAAKDIYNATKESIELEEDRAAAILQSARDAYSATIQGIEAQRTAILEQKSLAESVLRDANSALSASFNAEKNKIQELSNARISGLNEEMSALSGRQSSLSSIVSSMTSLARRLSSSAGLGGGSISDALSAARRGDFSQAEALSGDLPNASGFSSAADFRVAQATAKNQLKAISDLASGRASGAQAQINALESMKNSISLQIEQEQTNTAEQIAALDNQYNELVGIDTNILSLSDAIAQYQDAQLALDELNADSVLEELTRQEDAAMALLDVAEKAYTDEIARLDEMLDNAQSTLDLAEQAYEDEIARLDSILESAQMQLDVLNGIQENTLSATQALEALIAVIQVASEPSAPDEPSDPVTGGATGNNTVTDATLQTISTNMAKTAQILQDIQIDGLETRATA